jgi:type II secretory pathway component PulC
VSIPQISEPAIVEEIIDRRRPVTAVAAPTVVRTELKKAVPLNPVKAGVKSTAAPPPAADVPSSPGDNSPPAPAAAVPRVSESAVDIGLTVSAIVFSDDPAARLAVVNELPVMEGTMIGDSRVEEIRADRVIFTRGGMRFAVPFDAPSP